MGLSVIQEQHDVILQAIKDATRGDWKCLIVDDTAKKLIDNVVKEDDILNNNIATIERITDRREPNPEMDAVYILTPNAFSVECLLADIEVHRYRSVQPIWTGYLGPDLRRRLNDSPGFRQSDATGGTYKSLMVDFHPKESHVITLKDPWSFPLLYHPGCNDLVGGHLRELAQKIAFVCISLGEYPKIRYYRPQSRNYDAEVMCTHLARFTQNELDEYRNFNPSWPPQSQRPPATLVITDRSMDLMAPLVHEFTYQAMAHDLLPIKDGDRVTFHTTMNPGTPEEQEKDMELGEKDKVWVDNRHRHMKDTIDKLMSDFQKFMAQNPHFTNQDPNNATNLNTIRDMLAGLPQFQEMKEAYSLHLTMAQDCMNIFQKHKLLDLAAVEQTMATGLDEDFKRPKNILDSVVRLLDDEDVSPSDRLRLIIMFVLYRDGVIKDDIERLLAHSTLPPKDADIFANLMNLGGHTLHKLKEARQPPPPLFPIDPKAQQSDEYNITRFEPVLKPVLDHLARGMLTQEVFPYTKPPLDPNEDLLIAQGGSLRAGRPNWAAAGRRPPENRQRLIVFMAGGATYSESRACYEVGADRSRDVVLITSHFLTPQLFVRQVGDLNKDIRQLDLPPLRPKPRAPAHLFERPAPPRPPPGQPAPMGGAPNRMGGAPPPRRPIPGGLPSRPAPPTAAMSNMSLNSSHGGSNGGYHPDDGKHHKEKKRRNFLGMKK